jgi:hypothetical protein
VLIHVLVVLQYVIFTWWRYYGCVLAVYPFAMVPRPDHLKGRDQVVPLLLEMIQVILVIIAD